MRYYTVKFCLREDARRTLTTDQFYTNFNDALAASLELETDPDIYTSWVEEDNKNYYTCGIDEGKRTLKASVDQLQSQILRLQERCSWWQNKHTKAIENYENSIRNLKERIALLKRGDNETTRTDI